MGSRERKEFHIEVRVRNNLLLSRRIDLDLSQQALAKKIGISHGMYLKYENLITCPYKKAYDGEFYGEWKPTALKIADFYKVLPEDLWPDVVLSVEKNRVFREASAAQFGNMIGNSTRLAALPPDEHLEKKRMKEQCLEVLDKMGQRNKELVVKHFGLDGEPSMDMAELGEHFGICRGRVNEIIKIALRRMRSSPAIKEDNAENLYRFHKRQYRRLKAENDSKATEWQRRQAEMVERAREIREQQRKLQQEEGVVPKFQKDENCDVRDHSISELDWYRG